MFRDTKLPCGGGNNPPPPLNIRLDVQNIRPDIPNIRPDISRKQVGGLLRMRGYKVSFAGDGEEFLEIMAGFSAFDVVLMDRYMPRLDGPGATK